MSTPRPTLVTIATDGFQYLWLHCVESQQRYAARHGYDHQLMTTNAYPALPPHWAKVTACLTLLARGHDVFLLDCDACIRADAPRFTDLLERERGYDIFIANGWSGRPNSGVVVFRGGASSTAPAFLERCLANRHKELPEEDRVTAHGENGHFIHFLKDEPFRSKAFILDDRWNKIVPPATSGDFIIHYTGPMRAQGGAMDGCMPLPPPAGALSRLPLGEWAGSACRRLQRKVKNRLNALGHASGVPVSVSAGTPSRSARLRERQTPTASLIRHLLTSGDVVVDAGARNDAFTRQVAAAVGSQGQLLTLGGGCPLETILSALDERAVTLLRVDLEPLGSDGLKRLCVALAAAPRSYLMLDLAPSQVEAGGATLGDVARILYESGLVLREIRDDHTLGPRGFMDRVGSKSYIAANDRGWRKLEARLGREGA
ncbi:hypothetical protein [Ancylobacter polymorphus]|uniref:Nucleotide-diphospho-sugar transferase domain-containing protein n=1 Tax=Ancylobacter polymorphus TaxID=223390 RepID=A0ABU0B7H9_9HYPH|nr:hypothetical protein [Ancylobacter polymorphus]MDQ0301534.1 hypothetical protein [Ancylobacter polymorphus]